MANNERERGFACIGLESPKFATNVGTVLRAASCYRVAQVNVSNMRARDLDFKANTPKAHRHIPTLIVRSVIDYVPVKTKIIAVDIIEGAVPLTTFQHPERAMYVFGPEDGTLGDDILRAADHVVYVPTAGCMNLACAVNVVLYDRLTKGGKFDQPYHEATQQYHRQRQ